jgi:ankyrin repeat protein
VFRYLFIASLLYVSCEPARRNAETTVSKDTAINVSNTSEQTASTSSYKRKLPNRNTVQDSLIDAVTYEDTAMIIALVKRGADVNARDKNLFYPLYWAQYEYQYEYAEHKDSSTINTLLKLGAIDYNAKLTNLFNASRNGNLDSVKLLISEGSDVNARRIWYDPPQEDASCYCFETPISAAAGSGNTKLVQYLLDHGAEINFDQNGRTPMAVALQAQDYAMADLLMQHDAAKIPTFAIDEASFYSYHEGDTVYIDYLINNMFPYASFDDYSPLRNAASNGNTPVVKRLVSIASKEERSSALCYASTLRVASLLLEHGADVNSIYSYFGEGGCSGLFVPICKAVESGDLAYVKFLVEKGANINSLDSYPEKYANTDDYLQCSVISPLTLAIQNDKPKIAEYLIAQGANVNFIMKRKWDKGHNSPLIAAVEKNNVAMTKLLLAKGALVTNRNISIKDYVTAATLGEIVNMLNKAK